MKRIDALRVIVEQTADHPVVATCAATSRELAFVADRPNHLYLLDSMGLTASVATGLALAIDDPATKVVAIDGDGSLLMNLGALATIGYVQPKNLILVVLDNASYASTAGIPTAAERIDLGVVAAACDISVAKNDDEISLAETLAAAIANPGPFMLHVRIEPGNTPGVPLLLMDPAVLAQRFQSWVTAGGSANRV